MNEREHGREVRRQIRIDASPATVFALLTDPRRMRAWLAATVVAKPEPGGIFRIAGPGGMTIEGRYLEVVPDRKVVFAWGGVEGLEPGQSTVEIILEPDGDGTLLKLRHYGLPPSAFEPHDLGWLHSGLPKLKAAAEVERPGRAVPERSCGRTWLTPRPAQVTGRGH